MTQPNGGPGRLVIVGAGGFGREVRDLVRLLGGEPLGFLDDSEPNRPGLAAPLLGRVADAMRVDEPVVVAIGVPAMRRPVITRLVADGVKFAEPLVHPIASVAPSASVGSGSVVTHGAVISSDAFVGQHTLINWGASVGHDAALGDGCSLFPGARVSGYARLGNGVLVGASAVILEGVVVGEGATIGAGAVVTHDVEDGATVVGVPARPARRS